MKNNRHMALLNLISEKVINTQEQLQSELNNLGFNVTQATVSRDIKALNIIKTFDTDGNYRYCVNRTAASVGTERYTGIFSKSAISIRAAMNDVIVKCYAGTASAACAAIDALYSDLFVGTLAGDDTILIITEDSDSAQRLVAKLREIFE